MRTDELRSAYLDFFKAREHRPFQSDSLVPADDPSLLFTGAGMNQFKPYFLGLKKDVKRATSCQKCLRTADLDRVGKTAYHHSFFEMLGNFSFGDYFKPEAIAWGWEFVTKVMGLPKEKLWVSVYQDDDEAFAIWKTRIGLPESRIVRMGAEDNFWPSNAPTAGPNGPCGPCSEIYVGETPGKGVEIWNLVFTQFDRQSDGSLPPLPQKNIDTGMGLERAAAVLQGVDSNFDTDNFTRIRSELKRLLKRDSQEQRSRENAVMDHIRAVIFSIADGALPSNEGRGYVIRKIIRLGSDHLTNAGAVHAGSLCKLVPVIVDVYGKTYPEIKEKEKTISTIIENEERNFQDVIRTQLPKLESEFKSLLNSNRESSLTPASPTTAIVAFKYYDTFGLPLETIFATASSVGLNVDQAAFASQLEEQKRRSRESSKIASEIFAGKGAYTLVSGLAPTQFTGYESTHGQGQVTRLAVGESAVDELSEGAEGVAFFDRTPFYAESGGQVGDSGVVRGDGFEAQVLDTQWIDKSAAHKVRVVKGKVRTGVQAKLEVDPERRSDIMKNHTATHLLHSALRKVLGDHVKQSGSLVAPDHLRFDFTHFAAVDAAALARVEEMVNAEVRRAVRLDKRVLSKEQALREGAMAFFGEKYGDEVRVVTAGDFSKELCGGTHLESTDQIGLFKIISESSIQAGVRRVEAVTGRWADKLMESSARELDELSTKVFSGSLAARYGVSNRSGSSAEQTLPEKIAGFGEVVAQMRSKARQAVLSKLRQRASSLLEKAESVGGVRLVADTLPLAGADIVKEVYDHLRAQKDPAQGDFVVLIQCPFEDKVSFVVGASPSVVSKGFQSGPIVSLMSQIVDGKGGGRPDYAQGGGKSVQKAAAAVEAGKDAIRKALAK